MTLRAQPGTDLLLSFLSAHWVTLRNRIMRLLLGCVYILLSISSEASGSPEMITKALPPDSCSQVKLEPASHCVNEDECPYQIILPPLTIQLPKQFQLLERTMKELESLKEMVRQLRSTCLGCSLQRDSGENSHKTTSSMNDSSDYTIVQEMQVNITNMSNNLKSAHKQMNELQGRLDENKYISMKEVEHMVDKKVQNITGVIQKLNGNCLNGCSLEQGPINIMAIRDCSDYSAMGTRKSGIFKISPIPRNGTFDVFCDMESKGGGWTVVQQRINGTVNFNRTWAEYKKGFGDMLGEFWLGNDKIHLLTRAKDMMLRIEFEDLDGLRGYAKYDQFYVANEFLKYRLSLDEYSGTAGNALHINQDYNHDHMFFTTWDRDNDLYQPGNCGNYYGSGWWFNACMSANLNGKYYHKKYKGQRNGIFWSTWHNISKENYLTSFRQAFKTVRMMIRPKNYAP